VPLTGKPMLLGWGDCFAILIGMVLLVIAALWPSRRKGSIPAAAPLTPVDPTATVAASGQVPTILRVLTSHD
jgi:hypothetical protein